MTTLRAGSRVYMVGYAQCNASQLNLMGATPQILAGNVQNSLNSIGRCDNVQVTILPSPFGSDGLTLAIVFTPSADVDVESVDNKILYGLNYSQGDTSITDYNTSGPATGTGFTGTIPDGKVLPAVSIFGVTQYVIDTGSITTTIPANVRAALPGANPVSAALGALANQQSTDPNANGSLVITTAAGRIPDAVLGHPDWTALYVVGGVALALLALFAVGYAIRSVR